MKIICIIVFLLLEYTSFSQTQTIDSIPKDGIVLNKGWKFHTGDDAEWSKTNLNDSRWEEIQLSDYTKYLPYLKNENIGWFRLHLIIDSLTKKQLALQFTLLGASEVYLNGKLFQRFGSIKTPLNYKSFNPVNKPFLLPYNIGDSIVIAIRFASDVPSRFWLFAGANKPPLTITVNCWSNALSIYQDDLKNTELKQNFLIFL